MAFSGTSPFAGVSGAGVFRSTDNGSSWTAVNSGMPSGEVGALAVSGTSLFAGTVWGVFRSTDDGASWTAVNTGLIDKRVQALAVSGTSGVAPLRWTVEDCG